MGSKKDTPARTVSLVMIIMLVGKVTGLLRDSILNSRLGMGSIEATAFSYASNFPRTFLDFAFASAISACFIPVFNSYIEKKSKKEAFKLADNFITIIFLLSAIITVIAMFFSYGIINIWVPGLSPEAKLLASDLLKIMLPTIVISAAAFSTTGILQSLGEFNIPAAMSICSNAIIVVYCLFFMDRFGIYGLAATFLIGWVTQLLMQMPSLIKKKYFYRPYINFKDSGLKEIGVMMLPVMVSSWVMPINTLVNMSSVAKLSGPIVNGEALWKGAPVIQAADTLYSVITGVVILSIANVIFPKLSKAVVQNESSDFGETMHSTLRVLFFLLLPMMFGIITLAHPMVKLFYERLNFNSESTNVTSTALIYYSLGMAGFGVQTILSRGFYAGRDTKTPLVTGMIAIVINACLSFTLVDHIGIGGPALAMSVSITLTAVIMLYSMYKKHPLILNRKMLSDVFKMFIISAVMAIAVYYTGYALNYILPGGSFLMQVVKLGVPAAAGVVCYMVISYLFNIKEAVFVFSALKRIIKKGKEE